MLSNAVEIKGWLSKNGLHPDCFTSSEVTEYAAVPGKNGPKDSAVFGEELLHLLFLPKSRSQAG
jgi:hypothetical protein